MKKLILIAIAFFTLNAVAQEQKVKQDNSEIKSSEKGIDRKIEKLSQLLDLTPVQKEKVRAVILDESKKEQRVQLRRTEDKASKKKMNGEQAEKTLIKQRAMRMTQIKSKLKEILTEEQYAKYEKILQNNSKRSATKKY